MRPPTDPLERSQTVARWFGISRPPPYTPPASGAVPLPQLGQIMLITGASGAGKSTLLRALAGRAAEAGCINISRLRLQNKPIVNLFPRLSLEDGLGLLSRVGLAEAATCLRPPAELSDGERWRLRFALSIARAGRRPGAILLADEFCALLDRITAAAVAHAMRRLVSRLGLRAIIATSHDDLLRPLQPDILVRCDFGQMVVVKRQPA